MGKKADEVNAVFEQNRLLKEQNELLRKQIELMQQRQNFGEVSQIDSQVFVKDLYRDEMRSGFLVTSHRKRLWNAQIGIINEFARICKKHNLRWFAAGGTLLGAARHKGFIPWDDDVDVVMLRPDYEKFIAIAPTEIKSPYFFDAWHNYRFEGEPEVEAEAKLPLVTLEQQISTFGHFPFFPLSKIRDSRTIMLEFPKRKNVHQGIWLDVFPLDPVPPFSDAKQQLNFNVARDLMVATFAAEKVKEAMKGEHRFSVNDESMENFLKQSHRIKARNIEMLLLKNFGTPNYVGDIIRFCRPMFKFVYDMECMKDVVYLPFEEIEIPAPIGYEKLLTNQYGDWHKLMIGHNHATDYSVNIPYYEYYKTTVTMK